MKLKLGTRFTHERSLQNRFSLRKLRVIKLRVIKLRVLLLKPRKCKFREIVDPDL